MRWWGSKTFTSPQGSRTGSQQFANAGSTFLLAFGFASLFLGASVAFAADHPSLVDPSKTRCSTCHGEKLENEVVHVPVAEACDSCHEFSKADGKTVVELMAEPPELCVLCHSDLVDLVEANVETPHYPVTDTCLNCHDPHSTDNVRLLNDPVPRICLDCHDSGDLDESHGISVSRAFCVRCHQPHGADTASMLVEGDQHPPFAERSCAACHRRGMQTRAKKDSSRICFACHDSDPFQADHVHSAVSEGKCLGCHDPHMSPNVSLTKEEGGDLCYSCHPSIQQKLGKASVHMPAEDSCDNCHQPHTGDYAYQLFDQVPDLCTMCHDIEDTDLQGKHLNADLESLECTMCHDPHGSDEVPLVASRSIHPPFADRNCEICHTGNSDELVEDGESALCLACHSEIEEIINEATHGHFAMEVVDCIECHTPHASKNRKLTKQAEGEICLFCHDDKGATEDEFQHGAITMIGCESCHEPHGGENERLLRMADVNALCLSCHDNRNWSAEDDGSVLLLGRFRLPPSGSEAIRTIQLENGQFGHPVANHRTLGVPTEEELKRNSVETVFEGELQCTSCHDPHKGRSPRLFVRGTILVCTECHEK